MPSRRDFLKVGLEALLAIQLLQAMKGHAWASPGRRPASRPTVQGGRPRYFASLFLSGGIDAIYTTDPKTRAEVEPFVDAPYAANAIVDAGAFPLGPHFAPLAPHAARLAIVNGVAVHTANHNTGTEQFARMRTRTHPQMPPIFQLIGRHRDTQAIGSIGWSFGGSALEDVFEESPDDLLRMAGLLRAQEKALGTRDDLRTTETKQSLRDSAGLLARAADARPLVYETWSPDDDAQALARSLQRVLWAFENDLTRCYEVNIGSADQPWDTHTFNAERQTSQAAKFPVIARFFAELTARKTHRGALADETLVVMGSEIGRYPGLNAQHGKDHFPEVPLVFFGAGIRTGSASGRTGRSMQASGNRAIRLDDVGATLLHVAGLDPALYGYDGEILEGLVGS